MGKCMNCGGSLRSKAPKARYCTKPECKRISKREYMREFQRRWTAEHGEPYTARYRAKRRADDRAAIAAGRGPRARNAAAQRAHDDARRARKQTAHADLINPIEVYERDGWICGLCHSSVDASLSYPAPLSPTIDHVVPLARGGMHTLTNVQLAHLTCNVRKGAATSA